MLASSRWFRVAWAIGSLALVVACSGKSSSDDAGAGGTTGGSSSGTGGKGGSSGGGTGGSAGGGTVSNQCDSFTACGGDVVGTWKLARICNDTALAAIPGADCATLEGDPTFDSDATFAFKSDGSYSAQGQIKFSVHESFDDACAMSTFMQSASDMCATLNAANAGSAQTGFSIDCSVTGKLCDCSFSATVPQDTTGSYVVDGTSITLTPEAASSGTRTSTPLDGTSDFCVDGTSVTVKASDGTVSTLTK